MKLTTSKLYIVITFTVISLLGIVLIQFNWIDHALKTEENNFQQQVSSLLSKVTEQIGANCEITEAIRYVAGCACSIPSSDYLEDDLNQLPLSVKSIVDSVFIANQFNLDYEFGLVSIDPKKQQNKKIIFSSGTDQDSQQIIQTAHKTFIPLIDNITSLNFFFPDERNYIASQIMFLLILSVLFILLISACFSFVILTIHKQKKLSEMKNDFINNLTHEFKTPIFSISLASKLLGKSKHITNSEKLNKYLELIHSENNRLRTQVDKVLQMALIDSSNFHLNKSKVDIHKVIEQVCSTFSVMLEEKKGTLNLNLDAHDHVLVGDEGHLANLVYNLIENGIKYSKEFPEISVATSDTRNGLCLTVKDNGIGIDLTVQKHIFDKFYRIQNGNIYDVKGFGLGLSYVKSIVEAHHGSISLKSCKHVGSEFMITLPFN